MTETVLSFFDNNGTPALGLTPSIKGIGTNSATLFTGVMTEVADGWYQYTIEQYNKYVKYLITVDGGVIMGANRYQYVTNELDAYDNKDDRKNTGLVIDNTAIAREVWAIPTDKPRKGSYGEVVQKEIVIPDVDLSSILKAIKDIPEGVTIKDIKDIMYKYDDKKVIEGIKEINKSIIDMTQGLEEIKEDIEETTESIETIETILDGHKGDMSEKIDSHKNEIMESIDAKSTSTEGLKNMIKSFEGYLDKYTEVVEDIDMIPGLMVQYSKIIKKLGDKNDLDQKVTYITYLMEDILSKLK